MYTWYSTLTTQISNSLPSLSHIETFISPSILPYWNLYLSPPPILKPLSLSSSHIETSISLSSHIWPPRLLKSLFHTYTVSPLLKDLLCSSPLWISLCPPPPLFGRQVSLDYPNISIWPLWPVPQTYSSSSRYSLDSPWGLYTSPGSIVH